MLNEDYKEMLQSLLNNKVKFLIVGAYAMGAYGYPRATGDIDIWVETSSGNSEKVYKSLLEFGSPLSEITQETFTEKSIVFQIGIAPRRVDIITHIDGVDFVEAYQQRKDIEIDGIKIPFVSQQHLIKNKKATGRAKVKLDAEYLENNI